MTCLNFPHPRTDVRQLPGATGRRPWVAKRSPRLAAIRLAALGAALSPEAGEARVAIFETLTETKNLIDTMKSRITERAPTTGSPARSSLANSPGTV